MNTKRILSFVLAMLMVVMLLPAISLAEQEIRITNGTDEDQPYYNTYATSGGTTGTFFLKGETVTAVAYGSAGTWYKAQHGFIKKVDGMTIETVNTKAELKVTGGGTFEYDGSAHTVSASVIDIPSGQSFEAIEYTIDGGAVTTTAPSFTEVGTYNVAISAKCKEDASKSLTGSAKVVITAPAPVLTVKAVTVKFDNKPHGLEVSLENGAGYTVQYYYDGGDAEEGVTPPSGWTTEPITRTEVGTTHVKVRAVKTGADDVYSQNGNAAFKITIEEQKPELKVEGFGTVAYDGKDHEIVATLTDGEGYRLQYSDDGEKTWTDYEGPVKYKEVGKYTVKFVATNATKPSLTKEVSVEITKPTATLTVSGDGSVVYDGKAHSITGKVEYADGVEYTVKYSSDGGLNWSETAPSITEIGTLNVKIGAFKSGESSPAMTKDATLEITGKEVEVTYVTITGCNEWCYVRKGAGTNTARIGKAIVGSQYKMLGKTGKWYKVQYTSTQVGYIFQDFITTSTKTETVKPSVETPAAANQIATIVNVNDSCNVRLGAGVENGLAGTAKKGAQFKLLATAKASDGKTWYKVQFTTTTVGYIHEDYVLVSTATATTPDTGTSSSGYILTIVNVTNSCNVRQGMGTNTTKLGEAPKGAVYEYLGRSQDGNWYQIQYTATQKAFVHKDYGKVTVGTVTGGTTGGETTTSGQIATITNCVSDVNVRAGASTSTTKLGIAKKDATYTVLGTSGSWVKIQYTASQVGYVYSKYVKLSNNTAAGGTAGSTITENAASGWGYIVTSDITVRSQASSSSTAVGTAKKSNVYKVLGKTSDGKWYKIQFSASQVGYVEQSYFAHTTSETVSAKIVNCNEWVNVRNAAVSSATIIGKANLNATYTYLRTYNNYVMVDFGGRVGCIHKQYAQIG